jgi:predicted subunit of tRNA(5-methylaminomethyl-2-thiouridylate) methyltransferase
MMNEIGYDGQNSVRKQAERAKTEGWNVVELLEQARELMAEDNAAQSGIKHLHAALREAESRANMLDDWYRRTYLLPIPKSAGRGAILVAGYEDEAGHSESGS